MSYAKNIDMAQCEKRFSFRYGPLLAEICSESVLELLFERSSLLILPRMATLLSSRFCEMPIPVPTR